MTKFRMILSTLLFVIGLGIGTAPFAQETPKDSEKADPARAALAVGLVRTINTDEVGELDKFGSYSSWEILLSHQQQDFNRWLRRFAAQETDHFGDGPEVLPGYNLRLNVHIDGQGYDLRLQDLKDPKGTYAFYSDEGGVIWKGQPLQ